MIVKEFAKLNNGIEVENSHPAVWNDLIKACEHANNILWRPEYENIKSGEYLGIWGTKIKNFSGFFLSDFKSTLKELDIGFKVERVFSKTGENSKLLVNIADIANAMNNISNEELISGIGVEYQVLRALNQLYMVRFGFNKGHNTLKELKSILSKYDLTVQEFLLNVCNFRRNPGAVSLKELPLFLGFVG